jgi:regulator of sigma E protease
MSFLSIIFAFLSVIFLLVLHELGHFVIAKRFGVKVEEFGIGYPPRLFGKKFGETLYSLNLLPFGAFVRIPGEDGEEKSLDDPRSFNSQSVLKRACILLGGVVSFWIIAAILLSIAFGMGMPQVISDDETGNLVNPRVQILAVSPGSPAESAGLRAGDSIKSFSFSGSQFFINKVKEVQEFTDLHKGQEVMVTVERGKEIVEVSLVPRTDSPADEGAMGIALSRTADKSYSFWQAPIKGIEATFEVTGAVIVGWGGVLNSLFSGNGMPKGVQFVGPIGIGSLVAQAAQVGFAYFLQFIAMISIYLAVFNILPIPSLDGGKLVFLLIEKLKGKPVSPKVEQAVTGAVFGVLILLMIFVTAKDIIRLL